MTSAPVGHGEHLRGNGAGAQAALDSTINRIIFCLSWRVGLKKYKTEKYNTWEYWFVGVTRKTLVGPRPCWTALYRFEPKYNR